RAQDGRGDGVVAELLGEDHRVDGLGARTAVLLAQPHGEPAGLGDAGPGLLVGSRWADVVRAAAAVPPGGQVGGQLGAGLAEGPLLGGELDLHATPRAIFLSYR